MANNKWFTEVRAETPLLDAAQRVLRARMRTVRQFLPLAGKYAEQDSEFVHQVRVASRRASAALELFAPCLANKRFRSTRKLLKKIRRSAGAARDLDVFQAGLLAWSRARPAREQPGLQFLAGLAFDRRQQAQGGLRALVVAAPALQAVIGQLRAPTDDSPQTLAALAIPVLDELVSKFQTALQEDLTTDTGLHQLRITGKRLRYAMEICVGCFVPYFRTTLYPAVEEVQEILGTANDSNVTVQWLTEVRRSAACAAPLDWARLRPGIDKLLAEQKRIRAQQRRRFAAWRKRWQKVFRSLTELVHAPTHMGKEKA